MNNHQISEDVEDAMLLSMTEEERNNFIVKKIEKQSETLRELIELVKKRGEEEKACWQKFKDDINGLSDRTSTLADKASTLESSITRSSVDPFPALEDRVLKLEAANTKLEIRVKDLESAPRRY